MKTRLAVRILVSLAVAAAAIATVALQLDARDVYKGFLDPGIPHHRAILDTLALLDQSPKDASLHNDLGCLIARDGFWRDALREFSTAADLDRNDSRPLFNAGLVHAWKSEWSRARSSFKKTVKRNPGNWPAWWMLGYCEERLGSEDAAVDAYKVSLRVDTSLFDVKRNPFAADTKLKSRVLLETLDKRRVRAAMPATEQLANSDRIASFFQRARPAAAAPHEESAPAPLAQGPVVTTVPPAGAPRPAVPPPVPVRPVSPRGGAPETTSEPPRNAPGPGGLEPETPPPGTTSVPPTTVAPGPGGGM
jgi:tetratricopeptide (TPR) repeat protein